MSPVSLEEGRFEKTFDERVLHGLTVDADGSEGKSRREDRSQRMKKKGRDGSQSEKGREERTPEPIVLSRRLSRSVGADGVEGDSLSCHDLDRFEIESGVLHKEGNKGRNKGQ